MPYEGCKTILELQSNGEGGGVASCEDSWPSLSPILRSIFDLGV